MKARGKDFLSGVALLTLSAVCAKLCGLFFKIPLVSVIGDAGMGYFNSAYVIYTFFYVLSTSGLPVGLSILVSESDDERDRVSYLRSAFLVFGGLGLFFCLLMLFFPGHLALAIENPQAKGAISAMAPALLAVCLSGCIRGYFQGQKDMMPTAVSQVIESVLKTVLGLLFAKLALSRGYSPDFTAAAALLGLSVGSVCSFIYLASVFFLKRRREARLLLKNSKRAGYVKRLLFVVLPVSTASIVISISSVIDLWVIMGRLQDIGYSAGQANALYGNYSGTAVPLFNLPAVLIAPIASSVIPYLTSSKKEESPGALSGMSLRICSVVASPCFFGLALLAQPILTLLFGGRSAALSAPLLTLLSPAVYFVALQTVSGAILQGSGQRRLPVIALVIGAFMKIACCYLLISRIGMAGAPIGTVLCYLVAGSINLFFCIKKKLLAIEVMKSFLLPCICGAACGLSALILYRLLGASSVSLLFSIVLSVPIYLVLLLVTGVLDHRSIPVSRFFASRASAKEKRTVSGKGRHTT